MCLGGSDSSNEEIVQQQEDEAEAARVAEEERQARLDQGLQAIKYAFEGTPTYETTTNNFRLTRNSDLPKNMYWGRDPETGAKVAYDNSGRMYKAGQVVHSGRTSQTGVTGGFNDEFYDKYGQSVVDYYMPQVEDQYKKAGEEATYRLARANTLESTAANTLFADLDKQNTLNRADVIAKGDAAEGELRNRVNEERASAEAQLYATEDPEVAANQALAAVNDISLAEPDLSPLADIFNIAAVGGAGAYDAYQNEILKGQVPGYNTSGATRYIS